jgi:hypothetical protein
MGAKTAIFPWQLYARTDALLELQMRYICLIMRTEHDGLG